jgi:Family of unknown function (DUF6273)
METTLYHSRKFLVIMFVFSFLFVSSLILAQTPAQTHPSWIYHGDGTATNVSTGQRVIVGLDMKAGSPDDNQIVNPVGKVLLKNVKVSLDPSSTVYVDLGNGFSLYAGPDGLIGTTDDVIKGFGRYVQKDVPSAAAEPLSWRLLDINGDQAIIICDVIIDGIKFNLNASDSGDWSKSNLRSWLNSKGGQNSSGNTTGFYNAAFNETEKAKIVLTKVSMNSNTTFRALDKSVNLPSGSPRRKDWKTTGTDTQDYVWALSGEEVFKYFGITKIPIQPNEPANDANTYFHPSYYAIAKGVKVNQGGNGYLYIGYGDSWLRTPGPTDGTNYTGAFMSSTGTINIGRSGSALEGAQPVVTVNLGK